MYTYIYIYIHIYILYIAINIHEKVLNIRTSYYYGKNTIQNNLVLKVSCRSTGNVSTSCNNQKKTKKKQTG